MLWELDFLGCYLFFGNLLVFWKPKSDTSNFFNFWAAIYEVCELYLKILVLFLLIE